MLSSLPLLVLCSSFVACLPSEHSHDSRAASKQKPISFQQRNLNTITALYNRTVYPTNLEFIVNGSSSVPKGLFNANVSGRITPLGNFTGFQDSVEYFFALAPVPQSPLYYGFSKIQIVEFSSQCPGVAASVVYFTESVINPGAANDGQKIANLKQVCLTSEGSILSAEPNDNTLDCVLGIRRYRCGDQIRRLDP